MAVPQAATETPYRAEVAWVRQQAALLDRVKPLIIEAVVFGDGRAVKCPRCGRPSTRYAAAQSAWTSHWLAKFQCESAECGWRYME